MDERKERLLAGLADAGCRQAEIREAEKLLETGDAAQLKKFMRKCRCSLVDEMHESQQRVDRIDYLIRQAGRDTGK